MRKSRNRELVADDKEYLSRFVMSEFKSRGYYERALERSENRLASTVNKIDDFFIGEIADEDSIKGICTTLISYSNLLLLQSRKKD